MRQSPPIADQLLTDAPRFDFFQAVKILEILAEHADIPGEGQNRHTEPVTLRGRVTQNFPASDIETIQPAADQHDRPTLQANVLNLAGAQGPLPAPYTELLLQRRQRGDTAFREFLEIFQHRLLALLYRTRKHLRLGLETQSPWHSKFAEHLYAFMGLGTNGLLNRRHLPDHHQLLYTGLLLPQGRSLNALQTLLRDFLNVNVNIVPFQGAWDALPLEQQTRIGTRWQNQRLGETTVTGTRTWNQQAKFRVELGPLNFAQFSTLLPKKQGYEYLCDLLRAFVGFEIDFDLRLKLQGTEIPPVQLGDKTMRLGWTTWPKTHDSADNVVVDIPVPKLTLGKTVPHELIAVLPKKLQTDFLNRMELRYLPAHTTVLRQGVRNRHLYLLCSGSIKVVQQQTSSSRPKSIHLKAENIFGEMSLLTSKPTIAAVETVTACSVFQIPQQYLEDLKQACPAFSRALEQIYQQRLSSTEFKRF